MAINFPNNPTVNDTFTVGSVVYTWDGTSWNGEVPFTGSSGVPIIVGSDNTKYEYVSNYSYISTINGQDIYTSGWIINNSTTSNNYILNNATMTYAGKINIDTYNSSFGGLLFANNTEAFFKQGPNLVKRNSANLNQIIDTGLGVFGNASATNLVMDDQYFFFVKAPEIGNISSVTRVTKSTLSTTAIYTYNFRQSTTIREPVMISNNFVFLSTQATTATNGGSFAVYDKNTGSFLYNTVNYFAGNYGSSPGGFQFNDDGLVHSRRYIYISPVGGNRGNTAFKIDKDNPNSFTIFNNIGNNAQMGNSFSPLNAVIFSDLAYSEENFSFIGSTSIDQNNPKIIKIAAYNHITPATTLIPQASFKSPYTNHVYSLSGFNYIDSPAASRLTIRCQSPSNLISSDFYMGNSFGSQTYPFFSSVTSAVPTTSREFVTFPNSKSASYYAGYPKVFSLSTFSNNIFKVTAEIDIFNPL